MVRSAAWVKVVMVVGLVSGSLGLAEVSAAGRPTQNPSRQRSSGGSNMGAAQQQAMNRLRSQGAALQAQEYARFAAKRRAAAIEKGLVPGQNPARKTGTLKMTPINKSSATTAAATPKTK